MFMLFITDSSGTGGCMKNILVVEDDVGVREFLSTLLRMAGYQLQQAENGIAAMKLSQQYPFDAVILDILMPEKDGLQTIGELRQAYPQTAIIAISGGGPFDQLDLLDVAKKLGAHATLSKPFDAQQLLDALSSALETKKNRSLNPIFSVQLRGLRPPTPAYGGAAQRQEVPAVTS